MTESTQTAAEPPVPIAQQIQLDPNMVAETLQRKNAQLVSQLVYENALLETGMEQLNRDNLELRAQYQALKDSILDLGDEPDATPPAPSSD